MRTTDAPSKTRRRPGRPPGADPRRAERLEHILDAACRAILERGFPATRISDIASAAGVSTGTVHPNFGTRDEVLIAALQSASTRLVARIEESGDEPPTERLARLREVAVPYSGLARDEYVLRLELWLRALHQPELLPRAEAFSSQWRGLFLDIVRSGAERGDFAPVAGIEEVTDRLVAHVDGLGFETTLGYRWTCPERMHERLIAFAAEQLGVPAAELAPRETA